jgi:ketosteroid isomerase-like protein
LPLFLAGCVATTTQVLDGANPAEIEQTIRALESRTRAAVVNRDRSTLEELWSDRLTVNAPNNQVARGKSTVLALFDQGVIDYSQFDATIESVSVDGDVVVIMGSETVRPIRNAPMAGRTVFRRFTNIWKLEPAGWRLAYRHANVSEVR